MHTNLNSRFASLETFPVLQAASRIIDPREWPSDVRELATYGSQHMRVLTNHFDVRKLFKFVIFYLFLLFYNSIHHYWMMNY